MNYKRLRILIIILASALVFACATKKEESHDEMHEAEADQKEWKEMDDFHMVMAETFHPFKDSANLEPAKSRASELVSSAETWVSAALPKNVDNDEMKAKLASLKEETAALVTTVTAGQDKAIGDQLTKVHDTFHEIQEMWYGGKEKHEHH